MTNENLEEEENSIVSFKSLQFEHIYLFYMISNSMLIALFVILMMDIVCCQTMTYQLAQMN